MSAGNHYDIEAGATLHRPSTDPAERITRIDDQRTGRITFVESDGPEGAWIQFDASSELDVGGRV